MRLSEGEHWVSRWAASGRAPWFAWVALAAASLLAVLGLAGPALANPGPTVRASVADTTGLEAERGGSDSPSISRDGNRVAFTSGAPNLVLGDTNNAADVFVRDLSAGTTTRVSVSSSGAQANDRSGVGAISADGRHVAFASDATNLVPGDTNGSTDVFVRDLDTSTTTRVSVSSSGAQFSGGDSYYASISATGRYIAFQSFINGASGVFVHDRDTDGNGVFDEPGKTATFQVSVASDGSAASGRSPSISDDGQRVAFVGNGALVRGDTNGNIYVRDLNTNTTIRASVPSDGTQANNVSDAPSISGDGKHVAFQSNATNLVPGDTNGSTDVFVRDLDTSTTTRVSVSSDGTQSNDFSNSASISADGRWVSFTSGATNLVASDTNNNTDVFVHDRDTDANGIFDEAGKTATTLESVASDGTQGNAGSDQASISKDGSRVAFASSATNLVADDINGLPDIFVHRFAPPPAAKSTLTVTKAGSGQGTVTSSPAGIDCGSTCSADFASGSQVTLTAAPASGSTFTGFSGGGCSGAASTCTVTMDQSNTVTATFAATPAAKSTLTVTKAGSGQGTVTSSPAGIDCGSTCSADFASGSQVTLTAAPASGSTFTGFSGGGCSGAASTCTVTMDQSNTVTATFAASPAGGGGGSGAGGNPPPGGGGSPPPPPGSALVPGLGAVRDTSAPVVSGLGLTNNPFVVGGSTPTFGRAAAKNTKKHKLGTTFGYTLSEAATVRIVIAQASSGRRRGHRCVAPTRKLRKAKKCTRTIAKGTLTRTSHPGKNRVAFSGRIGSRKLAPGRYQATITATDAAKNTSKAKTISFTIVKR